MAFLTSIPSILLIILGFGLLIFIHELGHFIAAKWAGIRTEAFAVGMGPVAIAWRKGVGLRLGSTWPAYQRRVREHLKLDQLATRQRQADDAEDRQRELIYKTGDRLGLGETEYSLRWLPIGGFVKMLGQEDANPNYISDDPRSYNRCSVGKRMIVVSAGVIMNLLLAIALFMIAFTFGVKFDAPVIGGVVPGMQASLVQADNAEALGVTKVGLQPGDVITHTDGKKVTTFADIQISSAMSRPDVPVHLTVQRDGVREPLQFTIKPQKDATSGLLSFGILPGSSTTLQNSDDDSDLSAMLISLGLAHKGLEPGMQMMSVDGRPVSTYQQFEDAISQSRGAAVNTQWAKVDEHGQPVGSLISVPMHAEPAYEALRYPDVGDDALPNFEFGLFGMVPMIKINRVLEGSANQGVLQAGDVVLRIANVEAPRLRDLLETVQNHPAGPISMLVLRDGKEVPVTATVARRGFLNSAGMLNISPAYEWDLPMVSRPMEQVAVEQESTDKKAKPQLKTTPSAAASLRLMPRDRISDVGGTPVANWNDIREQLRIQTRSALDSKQGATVPLTVVHATPTSPSETLDLSLTAEDVQRLHALSWHSALPAGAFEPIYTTLTSGGNPLRAIAMGFKETHKTMMLTYLTLDRLFRGSVGISQLRGPVGIVHIGTKIADRGFLYILFFLGLISVNLAVINFLPMPIVDGGLFLFLVYEKIKGTPPPLAFQNAATIVGICMIASLFLITFYNDVMRLLS